MPNKSVEKIISQFPDPIQEITNSLRQIVLESSDNFKEEIKWGMPSYSINNNICYLQPSKKHVNLGFYAGGQLDDKYNLLGGEGKKMRHIRVKNIADVDETAFGYYINQAIDLDRL
ncbi:DUF1801 domain-containing protein [Gracilibacillus sp. D59]|uniref:DUF1801 domain-containing protein n=1 Tax=Gracilibacillus sp. D59 TaxID=3457434 RepID=UPI003FCEDC4A